MFQAKPRLRSSFCICSPAQSGHQQTTQQSLHASPSRYKKKRNLRKVESDYKSYLNFECRSNFHSIDAKHIRHETTWHRRFIQFAGQWTEKTTPAKVCIKAYKIDSMFLSFEILIFSIYIVPYHRNNYTSLRTNQFAVV